MSEIKKAKIYKIYDNTNGNIYYGSTTQKLSYRLTNHRNDYKKFLDGKRAYVKSFDIIQNGDFTISLVEEFEYESKDVIKQKERYYIENNQCVNKQIPGRTKKQYREDNREKFKQWKKESYLRNKEKRKEEYHNNKEKYNIKIDCPICGCNVVKKGLPRHQRTKKCQSYIENINKPCSEKVVSKYDLK